LRKPVVVGTLVLAWAAGCGSRDPSTASVDESTANSSSAIQGGMADTTHDFAVGVLQHSVSQGGAAFCSGVLLAPNLVATARHCVSQISSVQIDCATAMFGSTMPVGNVLVTPSPTITQSSTFYRVASITVPPASAVCGNDIAFLILSSNISASGYVTPTINPPMTDHSAYTTVATAIGYGVDTPTDTMGTSAGVRRVKQNIKLACIPNDKTFTDCFSYPNARQFISPNEFEGGDGTCEGDSGSGAYDQGSFNNNKWVAFGVLSRGGGTPEGGTCLGSVYTRFDSSWAQLLIDTAGQAALMGGYNPPTWTGLPPSQGGDAGPALSDSSAPVSSSSDASAPGSSLKDGGAAACTANGAVCGSDTDCCSVNCITHDTNAVNRTYACTACDANNGCSAGFGCQQGVCVFGAPTLIPADAGHGATVRAGCAVSPLGSDAPLPWRTGAVALLAATLVAVRRRRICRNFDSLPPEGDPSVA
jgi:hypothetical protein